MVRPPSLVVGVGASRGVSVQEVLGLVRGSLESAGLSAKSVGALATVDAKADEEGILGAARELGVELLTFPPPGARAAHRAESLGRPARGRGDALRRGGRRAARRGPRR